jgi:hypothetical protein
LRSEAYLAVCDLGEKLTGPGTGYAEDPVVFSDITDLNIRSHLTPNLTGYA